MVNARIRSVGDFLALLKGVKRARDGQYEDLCPGHDDREPSLSIRESEGKILLKCFAGCELIDILKPLGLKPKDLFLNSHSPGSKTQKKLVAAFSYEIEKGKEAYQIRRFNLDNGKKTFEVWHKENGKYVSGMGEYKDKLILYRLPELKQWILAGKHIYLPEGEGKADRLISLGLAATTSPFGAGHDKWKREYSEALAGAKVVILPDNDKPGHDFAQHKAASLRGVARSVKVVELPGLQNKGDDIIDWLDNGGDVAQLQQLADSCPEYEPPPNTKHVNQAYRYTLTDSGNAERFDNLFGDVVRYVKEWRCFIVYSGKLWKPDMSGAKMLGFAKDVARAIYHETANELDDTKRQELAKHARSSESEHRRQAMVKLLMAEPGIEISQTELDRGPFLLNCSNGTIDLRTGELRPHNKADLITQIAPVEYKPDAKSELWETFLQQVFAGNQDVINYVQRAVGYSASGDNSELAMFFNYGTGFNGKSTLLGAIQGTLGSDYATEVDPGVFMVQKHKNLGPDEASAELYKRRFVKSTETQEGEKLSVGFIKKFTGGEDLHCNRKYQHAFNYRPTHKLWLSGNHEPVITDTTDSIWGRLKKIPFTTFFAPEQRIPNLRDKLTKEHKEAILAWIVQGCLAWQKQGLAEPEAISHATKEYREDQDILRDFLNECCTFQASATIAVATLYKTYKQWCDDNDTYCLGKNTFNSRLQEKGMKKDKGTGNKTIWRGIRLLFEDEKVNLVNLVTENPRKDNEHFIYRDFPENSVTNITKLTNDKPSDDGRDIKNGDGNPKLDLDF